ncbi:MAG: hypothetical protein LBR47_02325 [Spirochaetaceae bacterium]|jgi:hypothetical protein|nr:hypothetical protein [Spirochaetaceae bacterium]
MQNSELKKDTTVASFISPEVKNALSRFLTADDSTQLSDSTFILSTCFGGIPAGQDRQTCDTLIFENSDTQNKCEKKLIQSFKSNLELLVQKTWIEKVDESLKAQVLFRINGLCESMETGDYRKGYQEFLKVMYDVVYLLFGAQARKDDFPEYAIRIDPEFGVFWWYIISLPTDPQWQENKYRIAVLLGMMFLANY